MRKPSASPRTLLFSATADHAVRAILAMAREPERVWRADELAEAIGAPRNYLSKTLNSLAKAGVLASTRGTFGGFTLVSTPEQLAIATVVNVFDHVRADATCLMRNGPCTPDPPCSAHERWSVAARGVMELMATTTIADLLAQHSS